MPNPNLDSGVLNLSSELCHVPLSLAIEKSGVIKRVTAKWVIGKHDKQLDVLCVLFITASYYIHMLLNRPRGLLGHHIRIVSQ